MSIGFKKSVSKFFSLIIGFLLATVQTVGFWMIPGGAVWSYNFDIGLVIFGAILMGGAIFIESRREGYCYAKEYILCIFLSPIRALGRLATFVLFFVACFNRRLNWFDKLILNGRYWSEAFYAVLLGIDKRSKAAQRTQDAIDRRERERREAEARQRAIAAERERQRIAAIPNDSDGHIFLNTVFSAKPANAYNYSETRTYYGGKPVIKISFTLDYKRGYRDASMERARKYCKDRAQKNYDAYCSRCRNSVAAPTIEFTISPGNDTAAY
jgi:hypothetical protein